MLRGRRLSAGARQLGRAAAPLVRAVLQANPVTTCLVASRFEFAGMDPQLIGGTFWGVDGGRDTLCFAGANLIPLTGTPDGISRLGAALGRRGRACASVVGPTDLVVPLWDRLEPWWGAPRELRAEQPLLVCTDPPACPPDDQVRAVGLEDLDAYYPAAVAMFTEEVGVDPRSGDSGRGYRARVSSLLSAGRAFARFEGSEVVFKAEVGALSSRVGLIQGVWVHPDLRGRGLAAPATAALVAHLQRLGRLPSLYVNAHNEVARAAYHRVGFRRVGTFASVLF